MLQVKVLGMALVARLRPSAFLVVLRLLAFDLLGLLDLVDGEDEDPRRVRVGDERQISGIRLDQTRQRIEMCVIGNVQAMPVERCSQFQRREQVGAVAGEERKTVDRPIQAGDVRADFRGVGFEAVALGPACRVGIDALGQLLFEELLELIASVFVRPKVEVEADDRKRPRIGGRDAVELFGELRDGRHACEFANGMPSVPVLYFFLRRALRR